MSGASNSRSKSVLDPVNDTVIEQNEESQYEKQDDESQDEKRDETVESTALIETSQAPPPVVRKYKVPFRNFLRDFKIQMQHENLTNKEVMKIASQRWKTMTYSEKEPYIQEAAYAKIIDNQKNECQQYTRQQAAKRRRKCPKCGKYAASSSPSEQSTSETTETGTAGNTESEDSVKNNQDYTGDSSGYSYSTETSISDSKGAESDGVNYDAAKKSNRQKKRTKKTRKTVKRRRRDISSSGSASYCANSSDNLNSVTSASI